MYWFSWKMHQLLPWKWQEKLRCVSLSKSKIRPKIRINWILWRKETMYPKKDYIIFLHFHRNYPQYWQCCKFAKYFSPITSSSSNYSIRFAFVPNQAPSLCVVYLWGEANVVCHLIYCYTGMSFGIQIRHTRPSPPETKRYLQDWWYGGLFNLSVMPLT